jgi:hypothetical protein
VCAISELRLHALDIRVHRGAVLTIKLDRRPDQRRPDCRVLRGDLFDRSTLLEGGYYEIQVNAAAGETDLAQRAALQNPGKVMADLRDRGLCKPFYPTGSRNAFAGRQRGPKWKRQRDTVSPESVPVPLRFSPRVR